MGVESAAHSPSGELRSVVVAHLAVENPPPVTLARDGHVLRAVEERPRAHPVALHVCGVQPCAPARGLPRRPVRPLGIDLAPGEALGEPLQVSYDYWWASVTYSERRSCPGTPRD
jgi:hypothetical protein